LYHTDTNIHQKGQNVPRETLLKLHSTVFKTRLFPKPASLAYKVTSLHGDMITAQLPILTLPVIN